MADEKLARATEYVAACMDDILTAFKPGSKITVMVRAPAEPTRDFMMTSDTIPELRAMLDRREAEALPTAEQETDKPVRIRLQRAKGWRMPENTVKVDRSTSWGNPFIIGAPIDLRQVNRWGWSIPFDMKRFVTPNAEIAVAKFRECLCADARALERVRAELRGRNLGCWCDSEVKPWMQPCHADVLLELANG